MAFVTVRNVGDSPVVIDRAGRVLGVRAYGSVDPDHAPARGLLERGAIKVIEPRDDEHVSDEARAAFDATAARNAGDDAEEAPGTTPDEQEPGGEPAAPSSAPAPAKRAAARRPRSQEA